MSSSRILGERDANASLADGQPLVKDVKSMEYHRQVLQSKIAQEPYVLQTISLTVKLCASRLAISPLDLLTGSNA
jgi:hypothetical protein